MHTYLFFTCSSYIEVKQLNRPRNNRQKDTVKDSVNNTDPRKPVPMTSTELDVSHLLLSCMTENSDSANRVEIRNDTPVETAGIKKKQTNRHYGRTPCRDERNRFRVRQQFHFNNGEFGTYPCPSLRGIRGSGARPQRPKRYFVRTRFRNVR